MSCLVRHKDYTKSDEKFIYGMIRDIKVNRLCYVKRPALVATIKALAPEIEFEYDKEDDIWIARYNHFK